MTDTGDRRTKPVERSRAGVLKLEFDRDTVFERELRRRVDEFFQSTGRRKRDNGSMYLKTAVVLAWFAASYGLLAFAAQNQWQALPLAASLGLATAAIGMDIQHDGGHRAYSDRPWLNRLMAMTMDLVGSSSYVWRWKHTVIHHKYVNIHGFDTDIDAGRIARLAPHQKRLWFHRWQHLYLWLFYAFIGMKVQLVDSWRYVLSGRIGPHGMARPKGRELAIFLGGKAVFYSWAFAIPMLLHPAPVVLFYYAAGSLVLGVTMFLVFTIPHLNADSEFPLPRADTGRMESPWMAHQARVTVNFARHSRILTWLLGGLNYHKEHHLFPLICHINYPAISPVVEQTCLEFGIPYKEYKSFRAGIAAHYRWLRRMATAD